MSVDLTDLQPGCKYPDLTGNEHILFVDDEFLILAFAKESLERHGYRVTTAISEAEALEALNRPGPPVDVVIADVIMPGLSGPELVRCMLERRPDLKVLFTTGFSDREIAGRTAGLPFRLIRKPFMTLEVLKEIRALF